MQHLVDPVPGRTAAEQLLPRCDDLFHGCQGAAGEDRTGNHHPRGDLAFDRQQCADTKDQRLQRDTHKASGAAYHGGAVGGQGLHFQNAQMALVPALANRRQHTHGLDNLGIAQVVVGVAGGDEGGLIGFGQRLLCRLLGEISQAYQDQRTYQSDQSE